jgi:hypothetical protein
MPAAKILGCCHAVLAEASPRYGVRIFTSQFYVISEYGSGLFLRTGYWS